MADTAGNSGRKPTEKDCKLFWKLVSENAQYINEGLVGYIKNLFPDDPHTVDRIFRDTLSTGLEKIHTLDRPASFRGWMLRIAENKIKGIWRSQQRDKKVFKKLSEDRTCRPPESSDHLPPDEKLIREEDIVLAYKILQSLPEDLKNCYIMHVFGGLKAGDLAKEFNISERTVYRRLEEAEELLKKGGQEYLSIIPLTAFEIGHFSGISREVYEHGLEITTAAAGFSGSASWFSGIATFVAHVFATILFTLTFTFLWMFSVLIGGQYCGLSLIQNASTIQMRRWLTRQLFFAYCGVLLVPLYYYYVIRVWILYVLKTPNWVTTTSLLVVVLFASWIAFFVWTAREYRRASASTDSARSPTISYRSLCGLVYCGFLAFTIVLALFSHSWWHVILAPGLEYADARNFAALRFTHLVLAYGGGGLILWFHISSFFLFRYVLRIAKDDESLEKTPPPFDGETANRRVVQLLQGLLCGIGLLFVSFQNIAHLVVYGRRTVAPILEISAACLAWYVALKLYRDKPEKRLLLMFGLLIAEVVLMYALRRWIYD